MTQREGKQEQDEAAVDALFRLIPPEFTAARKALATRLHQSGREAEAAWVRTLAKPTISAWTVNQLYWRHRKDFERLVHAGQRFRRVQSDRLAGHAVDIRGPLGEFRDALSELSRLAVEILHTSSGRAPTGVVRRVTATLEALASHPSPGSAPRVGRLVEDVAPPGFKALAALVPRVGDASRARRSSRVLVFHKVPPTSGRVTRKRPAPEPTADQRAQEQRRKLAAARNAQRRASRALAAARKTARQAQVSLKQTALRAMQAERRATSAARRVQVLADRAAAARQRARQSASRAESAAQAVTDAEAALAAAQRACGTLKNDR